MPKTVDMMVNLKCVKCFRKKHISRKSTCVNYPPTYSKGEKKNWITLCRLMLNKKWKLLKAAAYDNSNRSQKSIDRIKTKKTKKKKTKALWYRFGQWNILSIRSVGFVNIIFYIIKSTFEIIKENSRHLFI